MTGKLAIGGLVAVAMMALSANTASAQHGGRHGGHYHPVSPVYGGYTPIYRPVLVNPVYTTPVYTPPIYQPVYTTPIYGGVYGGSPFYGNRYYGSPYYGGGFNTVNFGVYRPGFGLNLGFVIR